MRLLSLWKLVSYSLLILYFNDGADAAAHEATVAY